MMRARADCESRTRCRKKLRLLIFTAAPLPFGITGDSAHRLFPPGKIARIAIITNAYPSSCIVISSACLAARVANRLKGFRYTARSMASTES